MSSSSVAWRIVGILVLIGILAVAGTFVYQAGYAQGVAHSAAVTSTAGSAAVPAPMPYPYYGYYPGMWLTPFLGFFPCLIGFFLIFFFFFAMRMIFFPHRWGRRGWRHHGYGPWGPHWEEDEDRGGAEQGKGGSGPTQTA